VGAQAVPSGPTIGTTGWEVPGDPVGFFPFKSKHPIRAYGMYVARPSQLLVLLGEIEYGQGRILLCPGYPVDQNNAFTDLLFFNLLVESQDE